MNFATDFDATDLGEVLTQSARAAAQAAAVTGVAFFFDYRGPTFPSDQAARLLPAIVDPLLRQAVTQPNAGFVFFSVDVLVHHKGSATVTMQITCTAGGAGDANAADAPATFGHIPPALADAPGQELLSAARALCVQLSGGLTVGSIATEGHVIRADVLLPGCPPDAPDITVADRHPQTAWLVGDPPVAFESIDRRLHRLGWSTRLFRSVSEAQAAVVREQGRPPAAVISQERYGVSLAQLKALAEALPEGVRLFFGTSGAHAPSAAEAAPVVPMQVPFSPLALLRLTEAAARDQQGLVTARSAGGTGLAKRPLALLADDNLINQFLSTEVLNMLGYEVALANNGQEAVDYCLARAPHVILMDIDMPLMDGIAATRELRKLESQGQLPHIPILAVTARTDPDDRQAATEAGMNSFIAKPIDIPFLHKELRRLVPDSPDRTELVGGSP